MSRIIRLRFRDKKDLDEFNEMNNVNIKENYTYFNILDNSFKEKRIINNKKKNEITSYDIAMEYWEKLPFYNSEKLNTYLTLDVEVGDKDTKFLSNYFNQNITNKTKSIWFPKLKTGSYINKRLLGGKYKQRVPIYIISKNRSDKCYTSKFLVLCEVPHFIVVEPQEVEMYKKYNNSKYVTILELDMKYKENYDTFSDLGKNGNNTGPGPARNFAWEHSISLGYKYHWVMDDNANEGFHYITNNEKIKIRTGRFLNAMENFMVRYSNLAISGMNYSKFVCLHNKVAPLEFNTRIYSFLLIRNDIPYRWRGRYNEDTDLSLRVLKDGWCTVQFNVFTGGKATTQAIKGGNTEEFYENQGTYYKSKMLEDMHPDLTKVVYKFNRVHHTVNYKVFKQKLKKSKNYDMILKHTKDDFDMYVVNINDKDKNLSKSELEMKYRKD